MNLLMIEVIRMSNLLQKLEHEKKQHRYWHRMFCISMLLLGGTWAGLIFYLLFGH